MNDEIKEILDRLKGQDNTYHYCLKKDISFNDNMYCSHILLDYITNLQQAIKDTKDTADDMLYELQQENERLKENNSNMQEEMARVWEENERLKQEYINVRNYIKMRNVDTEVEDKALLYNIELENINKKKYLDYKSRCEKASEILKYYDPEPWSTYQITGETLLNLLNILQGENERLKEENNNKAMNDYAHAIDESWYRELYDDYKSRCEKASEYINNFSVDKSFNFPLMKSLVLKGTISEVIAILKKLEKRYCNEDK